MINILIEENIRLYEIESIDKNNILESVILYWNNYINSIIHNGSASIVEHKKESIKQQPDIYLLNIGR